MCELLISLNTRLGVDVNESPNWNESRLKLFSISSQINEWAILSKLDNIVEF